MTPDGKLSDGDLDELLMRISAGPIKAVVSEKLSMLHDEGVRNVAAGLAAALAAHTLAPPGVARVALLGTEGRGGWALRALSRLRPLHQVALHTAQPFVTGRVAAALAREMTAKLIPTDAQDEALLDADIVFLDAPAPLYPELVGEGAHVGVLWPDARLPDLLGGGLLVVEEDEMRVGSLAHAMTLLEVLAGDVTVLTPRFTVYLAGRGDWAAARVAGYLGSSPARAAPLDGEQHAPE